VAEVTSRGFSNCNTLGAPQEKSRPDLSLANRFLPHQQHCDSHAAGNFFRARLNCSITFVLNAGISSGLRLVTRLPSTTTSLSTHSAPHSAGRF
jgi:hypothetical protein